MRALVLVALAVGAVGCGPSLDQLRWRASHDLNCPENQIVMTPLDEDGDRWGLRGCDRAASYALSEDTGKGEWVLTQKPEADPPPPPAK